MNTALYHTEIIKNADKTFIKEWKQLWEKAENANLYNSPEWFSACLDTNNIQKYEIHALFKKDILVALLPLTQYRVFGINVFGTFDKDHLVDTAFLIEKYDKKIFEYFFKSIINNKNIYLQKIDSRAAEILKKSYPKLFFSLISVNPLILLPDNPYSNIVQSTHSRIQKILKKNPELHLKSYNKDFQKQFQVLLRLQESSSKKKRSMDIFGEQATKTYYQNIIKYCSRFLRFNFLYYGETPIAYEIGYKYHDYYAGDQISYHHEYKKLVPGKLLVYLLMEALKKQHINVLDQGGGISSYKMSFSKDYRILYNVYYSKNPMIMIWWKLINKVRRIKQIMFPKKYTRDHEFLFKEL